MISYEYSWCKC